MTTAVLTGALRLALDSWRGQLVVLGGGAALLGLLLDTAGLAESPSSALLAATLGFVLLLAASVRAAHTCEEEIDLHVLADELVALGGLLPRLGAQVLIVAFVPVATTMLAMQAASTNPVLGLALLPATFAVAVVAMPVALLATVAVVVGDRAWLPTAAVRAVRADPLHLVWTSLVGSVVAGMAAVPLVLTGMVVAAVAGPLGLVGTGVAAVAATPWMGCLAVSMWRRSGAQVTDGVDASAGVSPAEGVDLADRFGMTHAAAAWVEGPAWDVAVEPGSVWGTWIRLEAPAAVAFRMSWSGTVPPQLALGAEDGTWVVPGAVAAPGGSVGAMLPAGNTYVQVGVSDSAAQAISIAMLVAAPAAAA